ncbi:MAG: BatD family protein [Flavobacteriales bacterium]|nr:BatD family protein [Flavobacteriales bacterium]
MAASQDVNFYASVDKNPVSTDDSFTYKVTLENGRGNVQLPQLNDFRVLFGPSKSSSYRIINNRQTSSLTVSYTLRPVKTGKFTIGQAKVDVDGTTYTSEEIEVEVVKGSSTHAQQPSNKRGSQSSSSAQNENIILTIALNKRKAYIGEQVIATYTLLTRYQNLDVGEMNFPSLNGFWKEKLKDEKASWESDYEFIDGVPYRKAILKQQVLFPQRSGEIQIDPMEISCVADRSFFRAGTELAVKSNSPKIEISKLPTPAPAGFNGAVGDFNYSAKVNRDKLSANESFTLDILITGSGNLTLLDAPEIKFPADFEVYDPETKDRINVSSAGLRGSRSFQFLAIPRYAGEYEIPEIEFTYFNPTSKKYITKSAGPFAFDVTGSDGTIPSSAEMNRAKNRVTQSASEIRYIITDPGKLSDSGSGFYSTSKFYATMGAPFVALIAFLIFRKRRETLESDYVGTKQRRANRKARKRLRDAEKALKAKDDKNFYAEIFKALYGYLGDKLNIPGSQLSKSIITEKLNRRNVKPETVADLIATLDTCEMARFASTSNKEQNSFYRDTVSLITKMESELSA